MKDAIAEFGDTDFVVPNGIINVLINKLTGQVINGDDPKAYVESFVEGTEPGYNKTIKNVQNNNLLDEVEYFKIQ